MPNMHKLEVRESGIHGLGVYAKESIEAAAKVGTYLGNPTSKNDTYVLWIIEEDGSEYGIDGTSDLRYLNHSAEPNAEFDGEELHALRRIAVGEEVTIHYGEWFVEWLRERAEKDA